MENKEEIKNLKFKKLKELNSNTFKILVTLLN